MTDVDLEALRRVVREELRAVGLRPPVPSNAEISALGAWRWDAAADAWRPVSETKASEGSSA